MPTFLPPLGHTSTATFPSPSTSPSSTSSPSYVQLNFLAELAVDEHVDGHYELWTDIADLDSSGEAHAAAGEWHAIQYDLVEKDGERYLLACAVVRAEEAAYAYTLRLVKESGEVHWMGNGGDNGVVRILRREKGQEAVVKSGKWEGYNAPEGEGRLEWSGIAASLEANGPSVAHLPAASLERMQLVVAKSTRPLLSTPFSIRASTATAVEIMPKSVQYLVISSNVPALNIPFPSALPEPSQAASFGLAQTLEEAVAKMRTASASSGEQRKDTWEVITRRDIEAGELSKGDLPNGKGRFLLVYDAPQQTSIELPSLLSTEPVLVQVGDEPHIWNSESAPIVDIDRGLTATLVQTVNLTPLRSTGKDDIIWLCATAGKVIEVGEEELEDQEAPIVHIAASPAQQARVVPTFDSTNINNVTPDAQDDNSQSEEGRETEHTDEPSVSYRTAPDGSDHPSNAPSSDHTHHTQSSSLVALIGRLIARVFAWVFWPFGYGKANKQNEGQDDDGRNERETTPERDEAAQTLDVQAVTERTPLLSTPGLSRSTSKSVFSALASPESFETIKPNKLHGSNPPIGKEETRNKGKQGGYETPLPASASSTSQGLGLLSAISPPSSPAPTSQAVYDPRMSAPHATIRSYIRFSPQETASKGSNIDGADDETDKGKGVFWAYKAAKEGEIKTEELAFAARKVGDREWRDVDAVWEACKVDGLRKAVLELAKGEDVAGVEGGEAQWQVQVTRA